MREPDGARVMRKLGVLQGARVQCNCTRLLAAGEGEPAVQAPERRQLTVGNVLAESIRRSAEHGGGLPQLVLQQPRLGERAAHGELILAIETATAQQRGQQVDRLTAAAAFERRRCTCQYRGNSLRGHDRSIQSIQLGGSYNPGLMTLAAHGVSHKGRRKSNEDAMVIDSAIGLFAVADGMGGHNAGEVASALAAQALHQFIANTPDASESTVADALMLANEHVLTAAAKNATYEGMGTTLVAACVKDGAIVFGSVGDSRLYLMRHGSLEQLTDDDSWVSRVLPADALDSEEAARHPMRHVLTKVIGLRDDLEPSVGSSVFAAGDTLLLCSDGLHGVVTAEAIAESLQRADSVEQIATDLVESALKAGSTDNITAVVVRKL